MRRVPFAIGAALASLLIVYELGLGPVSARGTGVVQHVRIERAFSIGPSAQCSSQPRAGCGKVAVGPIRFTTPTAVVKSDVVVNVSFAYRRSSGDGGDLHAA